MLLLGEMSVLKNYYTRVPHCMKRHARMSPGHVYRKDTIDFVYTSFGSWVVKKSCHGQTLINECSIFDYPSNFEGL